MQESAFSLMQMARISAKLHQLSDAGLLYVAILTDPTYGGVTASFAMLGDLIIAEPGARIGLQDRRSLSSFSAAMPNCQKAFKWRRLSWNTALSTASCGAIISRRVGWPHWPTISVRERAVQLSPHK